VRSHRTAARRRVRPAIVTLAGVGTLAVAGLSAPFADAASPPFISGFTTTSTIASTVPANGDVNPYGVAVVPSTEGDLVQGDVLVSNFNDGANKQGTGRTIVEVSPGGEVTPFAHLHKVAPGVGLTTALAVLPNGFVVVGSLPTTNGKASTATAGGLFVLNDVGTVVETITAADLNGPWDLTATTLPGGRADLFVTNVLNGTVAAKGNVVDQGTVVRLTVDTHGYAPTVVGNTVIGSGFPERTDAAALVVGPTGVGLGPNGTLYVADTQDSEIRAIPHAVNRTVGDGTGTLVTTSPGSLLAPLGLAVAPNGDILAMNGGDGYIVETTPAGDEVATFLLDSTSSPGLAPGNGALFGLAIAPGGTGVYYVDDVTNTLDLFGP